MGDDESWSCGIGRDFADLVDFLMSLGAALFSVTTEGKFWLSVQGYHAWLMSKDLHGTSKIESM